LPIFENCDSTFFNCAGFSSTCLPVYVIFIRLPLALLYPEKEKWARGFGNGPRMNAY
jgi:hypothetical protein